MGTGRCNSVRLFLLGLLMLTVAYLAPLANGQQVGVSLKLFGVTVPNNSLVDIDDILYRAPIDGFNEAPSNNNPELHDRALLCVTDLEDCCDSPHTVRGNWFYPDGNIIQFTRPYSTFRRNRGPNEVINGRQFYGSVRLFRKWSQPRERGRFRCELPSAADPNVTQILYASIVDFDRDLNPVNITLSSSGLHIAGNTVSLMCSATLVDPVPLPTNVPCPTFEWFFGPSGNAPLPFGVTTRANFSGYTFTSTLQLSPLNQSHAGMYTCRIGAGTLKNSINVSVDVGTVQITPSGAPMVGQSNYTLTCNVQVSDYLCPLISYQWIKNNSTTTQHEVETESSTLSFSPLRLSDAGQYTCQATIRSFRINNDVSVTGTREVRIQVPAPSFVILSSNAPNPVRPVGSAVTLTCTVQVELSQALDVPMTLNTVWTGPDGFTTATTNTSWPIMATYTSTAVINSFGRNNSGIYTCRAALTSSSTNIYLINGSTTSDSDRVTTGVYLALRNRFIANNTQIYIRSIGLSSDIPNSALQCITDKNPCCSSQNPRHGEWYLPTGMLVQGTESDTAFHRCRGDNGEVYLNRPTNVSISQTGRFCCDVPDATGTNQTLCVIIGQVFITMFGSPIAGESYFLECSSGGTLATFHWRGPPNAQTPIINDSSIIISSNSSSSQLQFRPLQQSHDGPYSCSSITDENVLLSEPVELRVRAPSISALISDRTRAIAGDNYNLTCRIFGVESIQASFTYKWTKKSDSGEMQNLGSNSSTLSFTPLQLSDAANYSCMITITSSYLTSSVTTMTSHSLRIQIPSPSSVALTSDIVNSILIIGSNVILTCTVMLNSAILGSEIFLVTVNAQLSKDGTRLALTGPIVTGTTFTYTIQLNKFQKSDFGSYTCTATVRPHITSTYLIGVDVLSDTLSINAAIPPPVGVRATQSNSSAPVEVSWSPPSDYETFYITGYRIFYGNDEQNVSAPEVVTSIGIRVNRSYDNESVSLRSEAGQIFSELIVVQVVTDENSDMEVCSFFNGLTAAVGVAMMVICLVAFGIFIVLCWWRRKLSIDKRNISVSANTAYTRDVNTKPKGIKSDYENLKMILKSADGHSIATNEITDDVYESITTKQSGVEYQNAPAQLWPTESKEEKS